MGTGLLIVFDFILFSDIFYSPFEKTYVWLHAHFLRHDPGLVDLSKTSFESILAIAARIMGMVPRILCCRHGRLNW